jgi:UDP-N-acetylmuramyl pentapeptide phosphotransferase/UDP-N-acetylglucosamine-1-phosphate transferase
MTTQTSIFLTAALFLSAIIAVYKGIPVLISAAKSKKLLDKPNDGRKVHQNPTPALGGVAILASLWIFYSLHPLSASFAGNSYMLAGSILLFVVGIKDDLYMMSATKKLAAQILAALFMVVGAGVSINTFGGVFGVESVPPLAGSLMAVFVIVVVINAMNLIDGVDGLAGSLTVISALFFTGWFAMAGHYGEAVFSIILAGAFLGFLYHNWQPASIFMGDTGALLSGFYLSILGIRFLNTAVNGPVVAGWQIAAPVILVSVLMVPLYDTLRVFMIRALNGKSPFNADADHIHHHLIKMGFSHQNVTLVLSALQIGFIALSIVIAPYIGVNALLAIVIASALLVFPTLSLKRKLLSKTPIPGYIEKNGGASRQKAFKSTDENSSSSLNTPLPDREENEDRPGKPERVSEPELEEDVRA